MMRKIFTMAFFTVIAGALSAANECRTFTIDPVAFSVKAGEPVIATVAFECEDGYELAGWSMWVHRKKAPPEFFAVPGLTIRKHGKVPAYDAVDGSRYLRFPNPMKSGTFPVRLNTAGLKVGDYAFAVQGHFVKDGKSSYHGCILPVSITAADDKTFAVTPQSLPDAARIMPPTPEHCEIFELKPFWADAVSGQKITVTGKVKVGSGLKITGWSVGLSRKNAPAAFFDRPDIPVIKHATLRDYDCVRLRKYTPQKPAEEVDFTFELDTAGFPAGRYLLNFAVHVADAEKKCSYYPNVGFELNIRSGK